MGVREQEGEMLKDDGSGAVHGIASVQELNKGRCVHRINVCAQSL